MSLVEPALAGDRLALARLVSQVENATLEGDQALSELYPRTGAAHLVGVTGGTGTGKSSLVNQIALHVRAGASERSTARRVAIVAVDPSSPFTGGALLGDRIRMRDLAGDPGIFIRSMASRGALGGLARRTRSVVQVLDACAFDLILIETVGAGQSEVDIASAAHTTLVIDSPGLGDEVQAIKAGILEIADILVVNKADLPGAAKAVRALRTALDLGYPDAHRPGHGSSDGAAETWIPPLLETVATEGRGVAQLVEAMDRHRGYLQSTGELARREARRIRAEMGAMLRDELASRFLDPGGERAFESAVERVQAREVSPSEAVRTLVEKAAAPN
jgi:LAO/AO transport system kinase